MGTAFGRESAGGPAGDVKRVLLVVPCYNEKSRLPVDQFRRAVESTDVQLSILFADDGSTDGTVEFLKTQFSFPPSGAFALFEGEVNRGKGGVLREAMLKLIRSGRAQSWDWVGFWDADLATPLDEVEKFLTYHQAMAPQAQALFGSRILRLGAQIERSALRHYLGRMFVTLSSLILGVRCYDSQCGAKLFRPIVLEKAFAAPFLSRWIFDLEILLRIGESSVVEVPVSRWADVPGSKVKLMRESWRVLKDLYRIRQAHPRVR